MRRALLALVAVLVCGTAASTAGAAPRSDLARLAAIEAAGPPGALTGGGSGEAAARPRIVGGTALGSTAQAPFSVGLAIKMGDGGATCTGSVLDATHVLTAAHCVTENGSTVPAQNVFVYAGSSDLTTKPGVDAAARHQAQLVRVHPRYSSNAIPDDVAVVTLKVPLNLGTPLVQPAPLLATGSYVVGGTPLTITGYGISSATADDWGTLRQVQTQVVTAGLCGTDAPAAVLCTVRTGHAACSGDSGGSGSITGGIAGVTDIAERDCARGMNLFANVAAPEIRTFIDAAVAERNVTAAEIPVSPRGGRSIRLRGTFRVGRTLTCSAGSWTGKPKLRYRLILIKGSRSKTGKLSKSRRFKLRSSYRGWQAGCAVQASNAGGTGVSLTATVRTIRSR
ncbi:S1 family peptidase [Patulibacter defluvii]|uniref:S1 family peptidase n=1 Tax=Patulibacter defluvii TaxID=3095358 RepID=UPI002A75C3D4|nr:trypsin-like serine protease [Patulibacter sp. DM4]